ncbi:hypothetical protein QCA50_019192 [Cerrena zonata]|uniref:Uncharacterized protein n=1 Tax=Cerrena zonata TaxID=2478898 RepID=A0AAW0F9R4_9APHY
MSFLAQSRPILSSTGLSNALGLRYVSSSPYGRTHIWKHRPRTLPKPFVPQFPQLVVRADGSTYTHYTTSPKSTMILTRDTSNNPIWNPSLWLGENDEEDSVTGRLGRFNRRFEGLGGHGEDVDWMSGAETSGVQGEVVDKVPMKAGTSSSKDKKNPKGGRVG